MLEPDDVLVERARVNNEQAWEGLVRRYGPTLQAHAQRMLRDPHAAEDAAQEVWVRAFGALGRYRTGTSFRAWIFTILTNLIRDHARRAARAPQALEAEAVAGPVRDLGGREVTEAAERAIAALPDDQREVLLLRSVEGLSHDEIAAVTGANPATVRWRLHRARERVAQQLGSLLPERRAP